MVVTLKTDFTFKSLPEKFEEFNLSLARYPGEYPVIFRIQNTDIKLMYIGNKKFKLLSANKFTEEVLNSQFLKKGTKLISEDAYILSKNIKKTIRR